MQGSKVKRHRPHILVMIALAVVLSTGWHGALRNALTDLRFAWQSRAASGDVVVVAIDAPSIEQIGIWPWPRRLHAELLHRLEAAGAQDVAFDVDFSTPSDPASDDAFVDGASRRSAVRRPAGLQAAGAEWRHGSHQPPADAVQQPVVAGRRQCRDRIRTGWCAAIRSGEARR